LSRAHLISGAVGGIIGAVTAGVGMVWSVANTLFLIDFLHYVTYLKFNSVFFGFLSTFIVQYPPSGFSFNVLSYVLAILLVVSFILSGVGFYGVYRGGEGSAGLLSLTIGIPGGTLGAILLILGNTLQQMEYVIINYCPSLYYICVGPFFVYEPNYLLIWIGMVVLAITFILFGSVSVAVSGSTASPQVALAAGILSIIGACLLFPYGLSAVGHGVFPAYNPVSVVGSIFAFLGFAVILVAFVLWAVVFYSSKESVF